VLATALVSVLAFFVLMGVMALGVALQGKRLRGSCGGNPDSGKCGCSPEKKAACRVKHAPLEDNDDEGDAFSDAPLTQESLAPPGEKRLIQLRTGRQ
jgi:hypothetical protein